MKIVWGEIFSFRFFSRISFPNAPEETIVAISNFYRNSQIYLYLKANYRFQQHRVINTINFESKFFHNIRKGFLIYDEMCKYLVRYEEAVSHIWLCTQPFWISSYMRKFYILFYQCTDNNVIVLYCKTIPLMYVHCTAQTRVQFLKLSSFFSVDYRWIQISFIS